MRAALLLAVLAAPALAQGTADQAEAAAAALSRAAALVGAAEGASDRIAALSEAVRAYEGALALLRDGLRRLAVERARLEGELLADRDRIARLLGALQATGRAEGPLLLLHPDGPLATARAGMILADVAPALQAEAEALRLRLEALREVEALQAGTARGLEEGLASVQAARAALAQAAERREDLASDPLEDAGALDRLLRSADTLDAFAEGLAGELDAAAPLPPPSLPWPLPVAGTVLRGPGEPDASGTARPGLVVAAAPEALVTAPATATLRFVGPLLDQGVVAILEPAPGILLVLSGLGQAWGAPGDVLPAGAPLGLMPAAGAEAAPHADLTPPGVAGLTRTLYLEVRDGGGPLPPGDWFAWP